VKKIFILTGEASGDKLASKAISDLKKINPNIAYLSVGGENLKRIGINSIYDLNEITYLGFTSVFFNIFKIKKKINETVKAIEDFNPEILFTVDSPDFTLRVAEIVKKNNPKIKTIHYVAPQVWIWREGRVKKIKKFIDHILLLFNFEKPYFDKENISNEYVGHPMLENTFERGIDINQIIEKNNVLISIFPGSRKSETTVLTPILLDFIKLMNIKNYNYDYIFHATNENKKFLADQIKKSNLKNIDVVSDENIKLKVLSNSVFAVSKSGTVSLQICNLNIPSIIIYKLSFLNFMIFKFLANIKFANIINIINDKEVIPELLQKECNSKEIFNSVIYLLKNPDLIKKQLKTCNDTLDGIRSKTSSSNESALILNKYLTS